MIKTIGPAVVSSAVLVVAFGGCNSMETASKEAGNETEKVVTDVMSAPGNTLDYDRYRLQIADLKDRKEALEKERVRLIKEKAELEKQVETQS